MNRITTRHRYVSLDNIASIGTNKRRRRAPRYTIGTNVYFAFQ